MAVAREGGLSGADEEEPSSKTFADGLEGFLDGDTSIVALADVLLHLVEHHERERMSCPCAGGERTADGVDEFAARDVVLWAELRREPVPAGGHVGVHLRKARYQRAVEWDAHVQLAQFALEGSALGGQGGRHLVEFALALEPEYEHRGGVVFRRPADLNTIPSTARRTLVSEPAPERPGGGVTAAEAFGGDVEFVQAIGDLGGERRDVAGALAVVEGLVDPQRAQHF